MSEPADLEIKLRRRSTRSYTIELSYTQSLSDVPVQYTGRSQFDHTLLRGLHSDPIAYGQRLGTMLLGDPKLAQAFAQARSAALASGYSLRLRLDFPPEAIELQLLRWELIRDPLTGVLLSVDEHIWLSRYVPSTDWQPVRLRPRSDFKAVVAIASPTNLPQFKLALVPFKNERDRAQLLLRDISTTVLGGTDRVTLGRIIELLRGGTDMLYLVCHGAYMDDEPYLYLENEEGAVAPVAGYVLAQQIAELMHRPRLIVLASCASAGDGGYLATKILGLQLAAGGVPAVVAMQGRVTIETAGKFFQAFLAELTSDEQIDRAMAVARKAVQSQDDFWMPVLYTRLRSGRIWYTPRFAEQRDSFEKWPALLRSIRDGRCTPILGSGLLEPLFGSSREIARRWADTFSFPMSANMREDLPQVAQFVATKQSDSFMRSELGDTLRQAVLRYHGALLPPALHANDVPLFDLINAVGLSRARQGQGELHDLLAALPFPLYVTTNPDGLLEQALQLHGKPPTVELCLWNDEIPRDHSTYSGTPSAERPLIYHLFGRLLQPESLVLTEDDYFNYLMGVTSNRALIPRVVSYYLTDTALLFLGFRLDDWNFRVLFRSVMSPQVRNRRQRYAHVAVQIDLDEQNAVQPALARHYLEGYFGEAHVSIYWGSAEDFIHDLSKRMKTIPFLDRGLL